MHFEIQLKPMWQRFVLSEVSISNVTVAALRWLLGLLAATYMTEVSYYQFNLANFTNFLTFYNLKTFYQHGWCVMCYVKVALMAALGCLRGLKMF